MTHGIVYCLGFTPNNQMSTLFKPFLPFLVFSSLFSLHANEQLHIISSYLLFYDLFHFFTCKITFVRLSFCFLLALYFLCEVIYSVIMAQLFMGTCRNIINERYITCDGDDWSFN